MSDIGKFDPSYEIERLLAFGLRNGLIEKLDVGYTRNLLLDLLKIDTPYEGALPVEDNEIPETATPILENLLDYGAEKGLIPENTATYRGLLDTRIMGLLMPKPSQIVDKFNHLRQEKGIQDATDWFYTLNEKSDYIRVNHIARNIKWISPSPYGDLEITINLSKPEKDPRDIAALKNAVSTGYPKCLLCFENMGYSGRINHPARQNLRVLPLTLHGEQWYFQYSPYVYYHQHCIVFNEQHIPMKISRETFVKLLEFVDLFPHYFIGSNADLPIVGGSILNHDHFQGGFHRFPMEKAPIQYSLVFPDYPEVDAGVVAWPMSALRLSSSRKENLVDLADRILNAWREYSDPAVDILSHSGDHVPHNTITPIVRRVDGKYNMDLVFRNNRTSSQYPLGIFHPHQELFHIKKENIGLIEVMGLFILPGRLRNELEDIKAILTGKVPFHPGDISDESHPLYKHLPWLDELITQFGTNNSSKSADAVLQDAVAAKCVKVLEHAGVFKDTEKGRSAFNRFLSTVGFQMK